MRRFLLFLIASAITAPAFAQLPETTRISIDQIVHKVLAETGIPAASIAIVKDGKVAYLQAYGDAKIDPRVPTTPAMRFKIGFLMPYTRQMRMSCPTP